MEKENAHTSTRKDAHIMQNIENRVGCYKLNKTEVKHGSTR